jgi:O-acetyl-ADP-ribose deacetylase (regulator of RNase III)
MDIEVIQADITTVAAEALVTAANSPLVGGGGVDGAIHRAAGPRLLAALRPLAPCPPGGAVITPAFDLPAPVRFVIHAVGPRYGIDNPAEELLASAYLESLNRADEAGVRSIAFPSLSTGAFHYPLAEAARISVRTLREAKTNVRRCILVAFDEQVAKRWRAQIS